MSFESEGSRSSRGLLAYTAVGALVVGIGALGLVHHLAQAVEKRESRVAALPPGIVDPEVTGSIGASARSVVIDPCVAKERLVVRGP